MGDEAVDIGDGGLRTLCQDDTAAAAFLDAMERVLPWPALCGLIEPQYDD